MSADWHDRPEGGSYFALWLIRTIGLHGGRRVARLFLYPIALYFLARRQPERRASREYLTRIFGQPPRFRELLRHFHDASAVIMDRIFLLAHGERGFDIETCGVDILEARLSQNHGHGLVLIGSHAGSFEALRALAGRRPDVRLRVVLDTRKTPAQTALFAQLAPDIAANIIDASRDRASVVLALSEAVAHGEVIALLADRAHRGEASLPAAFLGSSAPFPAGPWRLAAALKVPVVLCFSAYLGGNRYRLAFEDFADQIDLPRGERDATIQAYIARYARRLEANLRQAPFNWFNFYDFWATAEPAPGSEVTPPSPATPINPHNS